MPIYEYKCLWCGNIIQKLQKNPTNYVFELCEKCKRKEWHEKIISKPAKPVFKGSGFYETDYPKKGKDND